MIRISRRLQQSSINLSHTIHRRFDPKNQGLSPEKSPLIMMHGVLGSKQNFNSLAKKISSTQKREVICLDARNHGDSPHCDTMSYLEMADDVKNFIENCSEIDWSFPDSEYEVSGEMKVNLLGHSMGGRTAMAFALNYPEFLEKLIVVDVSPDNGRTSEISGAITSYVASMHKVNFNNLHEKYSKASDAKEDVANQLSHVVKDKGILQFLMMNMVQNNQTKEWSWRANIKAINQQLNEISAFPYVKGQNFTEQTLFISGEKSPYISLRHYQLINELFPSSDIKVIEDAGHWVHADKPAEFLEVLMEFIE